MQRVLLMVPLLLALSPAVWAQDKDKPKPDKPETPAAAAEKELKDLNADFTKAQQELFKPLQDVKTQEEAQKIMEKENLGEKQAKLVSDFSKRAMAIAEKYAKDKEAAADALIWVVTHAEGSPDSTKAIDLIIRDHLSNKKIESMVLPRLASMPLEANEKLFRAIVEKADTPDRMANTRMQLARFLKGKAEAAELIKTLDENTKKMVEQRVGKEALAKIAAADPAKAMAEAEKLFENVVKDAEKDKSISASVKESAAAELFEMQHLSIGKQPPEIEGEDIDGKKFKLSDYKGKVVVIDFWGNW
jgi:hypothetical protein